VNGNHKNEQSDGPGNKKEEPLDSKGLFNNLELFNLVAGKQIPVESGEAAN